MTARAGFLVLLAFSHFACAETVAPPASAEKEYIGCLSWGFEEAFFRPFADEGRVQWWVARVPENFPSWLDSVPAISGYRLMFARVIATVGSPGRFGHLGLGSREIEISEIMELRQYQTSDGVCHLPPPPVPHPDSFRDE